MSHQVELAPLRCINCDTPVPAEPDQVAWACAQCAQGLLLDESEVLLPLEIHYAPGVQSGKVGRPFWVTWGRVTLEREADQGWFDRSENHAKRFWEEKKKFFIPAYTTSLDELLDISAEMLAHPPDLATGPQVPFEPVTLSAKDLSSLVEFIILAVEAGRKDKVKSIDISVELDTLLLWILP